ncbi:hypothetical protein [Paraburkholderia atlantica]|uniref:hypothetical protein n=1 Tax=Paraburkholderia atlantica TaxID=2654982 RepID=UPI0017993989|nr:hypothetical protein [Paraburkholderia atlantica]MBB5505120.1 DNA-binding transcriptional LysR family regulator [Paraburkholderia atlantica]
MKLHSKLKPVAALAAIVLLTGYAGSVFADDAAVSYLPPVQAHPAVPKDPIKAQRKTEQPPRPVSVVSPPIHHMPPKLKVFIEWLSALCAGIPALQGQRLS